MEWRVLNEAGPNAIKCNDMLKEGAPHHEKISSDSSRRIKRKVG